MAASMKSDEAMRLSAVFLFIVLASSAKGQTPSDTKQLALNSAYKLGLFGQILSTCDMAYLRSDKPFLLLQSNFPTLKMELYDGFVKGGNEAMELYQQWLQSTPTHRTPDNACIIARGTYLGLAQRINEKFAR